MPPPRNPAPLLSAVDLCAPIGLAARKSPVSRYPAFFSVPSSMEPSRSSWFRCFRNCVVNRLALAMWKREDDDVDLERALQLDGRIPMSVPLNPFKGGERKHFLVPK
ncbi:hypothetical protein Nepgr_028012 [Nepenthes gracilis]|uniref:Uncharacterized protein n=1 Tax=Nepenthes gracilis TaxID=150966 RepID=A0AAD3TBE1_NEPGR|nr:hypothetical protein Nepgr_028012 [Nepenthes gracilis]